MFFWCLRFPPKNEQKQIDLRYHSSKVEFLCSFFGGNWRHQKPFRNYLTFTDWENLSTHTSKDSATIRHIAGYYHKADLYVAFPFPMAMKKKGTILMGQPVFIYIPITHIIFYIHNQCSFLHMCHCSVSFINCPCL